MAGNSELARALVDLAEHSKLLYCVGYMKRYDDGVIKAKSEFDKLIINQSLGNLLQISAHCYMGDSYCKASGYIHASEARPAMQSEAFFAPEWLPEKHKDNFARYLNVHSHLLNLIRYFIEDTPSVEYFNYLNSKAHVCIMRTKQQLITVETGEVEQKDWQEKCTFIFEQGQLIVTLPPALLRNVPAKVEIIKNEHISEKVTFQPNWSWAFKNQAAAFITSLQNKELRNKISAIEALKDLELTENIWRKVCK